MTQTLVFVNRSIGCPLSTLARRILEDHAVDYLERWYDTEPDVKSRLLQWTGFLSVPTLYVAGDNTNEPVEPPEPLDRGASPRGIDRGSMLTEPSADQLLAWLVRHGFVDAADTSAAG
jgi:glutaredoxin